VASYGHGYGWAKPLLLSGMISVAEFNVPDTKCQSCFVVDAAFIGGQSGSPVVNEAGEMVMIVQMTSDRVGIGVGAKTIDRRVGRFFGKAKP
jgi:S1-C subfamily serine protease